MTHTRSFFAGLFAVCLGLAACSKQEPAASAAPKRSPSVEIVSAEARGFTAGAMMAGDVLASTAIAQSGVHHLEIPIIRPQGATSDLTFWIAPGAVAPGDERLLGVIVRQVLFVAAAA